MLKIKESIFVNAPPNDLLNIYKDFKNWSSLFTETIGSTKLICTTTNSFFIEVSHKSEGDILNIMTMLPGHSIKLREFKEKYDAIFINVFTPVSNGTNYSVEAEITLKNLYKLLTPFVKQIVKNRVRNFVLEPLKRMAEKNRRVS